jgi:L-2-amino-thiazoline-4-carboxylic acid hydrolase
VTEKKHKFLEDSHMSYEEVFSEPYKYYFIPLLQDLSKRLKDIDFIETLKAVKYEGSRERAIEAAKKSPITDFASFTSRSKKKYTGPFWEHVLTYTFAEDTENVLEWKITECVWAKTFREANASDIGYATSCYGDLGSGEALAPKIRFTLTKTLMQGHDCCNHRYVWEG